MQQRPLHQSRREPKRSKASDVCWNTARGATSGLCTHTDVDDVREYRAVVPGLRHQLGRSESPASEVRGDETAEGLVIPTAPQNLRAALSTAGSAHGATVLGPPNRSHRHCPGQYGQTRSPRRADYRVL